MDAPETPKPPKCGVQHPMKRHADLHCDLPVGHEGDHKAYSYDGYKLHWTGPLQGSGHEDLK